MPRRCSTSPGAEGPGVPGSAAGAPLAPLHSWALGGHLRWTLQRCPSLSLLPCEGQAPHAATAMLPPAFSPAQLLLTSCSSETSIIQDPTSPGAGPHSALCSTGADLAPLVLCPGGEVVASRAPWASLSTHKNSSTSSASLWPCLSSPWSHWPHCWRRVASPCVQRVRKAAALRARTGRGRTWSGL